MTNLKKKKNRYEYNGLSDGKVFFFYLFNWNSPNEISVHACTNKILIASQTFIV